MRPLTPGPSSSRGEGSNVPAGAIQWRGKSSSMASAGSPGWTLMTTAPFQGVANVAKSLSRSGRWRSSPHGRSRLSLGRNAD
jgi:hypothetical protein